MKQTKRSEIWSILNIIMHCGPLFIVFVQILRTVELRNVRTTFGVSLSGRVLPQSSVL